LARPPLDALDAARRVVSPKAQQHDQHAVQQRARTRAQQPREGAQANRHSRASYATAAGHQRAAHPPGSS
jgi:hypothetical protein